MSENYIEKMISASDGLKLYVRDYRPETQQTGRTILCLAGLTRNSKDFNKLSCDLQGLGHRVVCFDYRGRGQSDYDPDWTHYHPSTYVSDIFNVCAALGLHDCIFIGTSLGGLLSMAMCVVSPGLVHSVVLNDVGPDLAEDGIEKIIAYTSDGTAVADLDGAVVKLKSYYPDQKHTDDAAWLRVAKNTYREKDGAFVPDWDVNIAKALIDGNAKEERQDLWPYFKALTERPVLVLRGEHSDVLRQGTFEKMLESLVNIKGVEIKGAGHAPSLNEEDSRSAIQQFLSEQAVS